MSGILIRNSGGAWSSPTDSGYANENELERLISEYPEILPGVVPGSFVCQQFSTSVGPIDLLIINAADGSITIVECKLAKNQEIRRKIVGQIFDYAASLRKVPFETFKTEWKNKSGTDLEKTFFQDNPIAVEVASNLADARFTLVLAVDEMNENLVEMTKYLNEKTNESTKIALLELARHTEGETEILVPQTFGYEEYSGQLSEYSKRPPWESHSYIEWLQVNEPESVPIFEHVLKTLENSGYLWGGTKSETPSGAICVKTKKRTRYPLVFHTFGKATVEVRFIDYKKESHAQLLLNVFEELNILDIDFVKNAQFSAKPKIPVASLSDAKILDALLNVCKIVSEN